MDFQEILMAENSQICIWGHNNFGQLGFDSQESGISIFLFFSYFRNKFLANDKFHLIN